MLKRYISSIAKDIKKHPVIWTLGILFTVGCVLREMDRSLGFACLLAYILPLTIRHAAHRLGLAEKEEGF